MLLGAIFLLALPLGLRPPIPLPEGRTVGTWKVWQIWEQSPDAQGLPRGPIKALILLGFLFLFLQTLAELVRLGLVLTGKAEATELERPSTAGLGVQ